jgi:hypothetical protein
MKADKVPKTSAPHPVSPEVLRRNCPCGRKTPGGEECAECEKKKEKEQQLRRSAAGAAPAAVPAVVGEALRSPGRPLPGAARAALEPGFGRDFSGVRVHTDAKAAESAQAVQARAYTVGQDVVFAAGQYEPDSLAGLHLLAHELAHTAQDDGGLHPSAEWEGLSICAANDPAEREAERAAAAVLRGGEAAVSQRPGGARLFRAGPTVGIAAISPQQLGDEAHAAIQQDFLQKKKSPRAFAELPVPEASLAGLRSPKGLTTGKEGFIDLALYEANNLWVAEIKPGSQETPFSESVRQGAVQVAYYLEKANSPDRQEWRDTFQDKDGKLRRIVSVEPMQTKRQYSPTRQLRTAKSLITIQVEWLREGILTYLPVAGTGPTAEDYEPVRFSFLGRGYEFQVLKTGKKSPLALHSDNKAPLDEFRAAHSVELQHAQKQKEGRVEFFGAFGTLTQLHGVPFVSSKAGHVVTFFTVPTSAGGNDLAVSGKGTHPAFVPGLSEADLRVEAGATALKASGPLKTSLPLLRNAPINLEIEGPRAAAVLQGNAQRIQPPIPGLRFTDAALVFQFAPEVRAEGRLAFAVGPAKKPLADGVLTVSADADGLAAAGEVDVHVPGVDQAKGKLEYRNRQLSGGFEISTTQIKIPGVSGGSLTGTFSDQEGVSLAGQINLLLPGNQPATLGVKKKGAAYIYYGNATFAVPGLKDVSVDVEYDGEHFSGTGHTTFVVAGLHGDITVHYRDGKFSGTGKADITRGKAKGSVTVHLSEALKLSGEGSLTYQLTDNLIGTAGVALHEDGRLRVSGALEFPKPVQLFARHGKDVEVVHLSRNFPIPGLSVGVVGVVAQVGLRFGFDYGVGPGEFRDVKLQAGFNPLEDDKNVEVSGHALLVIPASAGVYLVLEGGVGVGADVGIASASATGGLTVRGDLGIQGGLNVPLDFAYAQGHFTFDARPEVRAALIVKLTLGAYVEAKVAVGPFEAGTRKDWTLAGFDFSPGLEFGVAFPVHYDSAKPFRFPAVEDLQFQKPTFDSEKIVGGLFGAARSTETKK